MNRTHTLALQKRTSTIKDKGALVAGLGFEPRMAMAYETTLLTRHFPHSPVRATVATQ
jgi:hypothetical protein